MNLFRLFGWSLVCAALCLGCKKPEQPAAAGGPNWEPMHAQPKLRTLKIYLGAEALDAELALTPEQEATGMMFRTNITDQDAMLFVFPVPQRASFWMKNCPQSISAAYINADGTIEEIHHLEKEDTNPVVAANADIQYVLEVNDGWFVRHNIDAGAVIRTEHGTLADTFNPH